MTRIGNSLKKKEKNLRCYIKIDLLVIILVLTILFIGVGYAEITALPMEISTIATSNTQDGVFITDVVLVDEKPESESKVNYYISSVLESKVVLDDIDDYKTFEVTVYNKNNSEYVFIDAITEIGNALLYDNPNIEMSLSGIEKKVTEIAPSEFLTFSITFKYKEDAETTNNILNSKINFRFKEKPKLKINTEIDELEDIYPDYEAQEYLFSVDGFYNENEINGVPVAYTLTANIDKPLTVKIYNEQEEEITKDTMILMSADGNTQVTHNYKLKVFWDNSNTEDGIIYNTIDYSEKSFNIKIDLEAIPYGFDDAEKYLDYTFNTEENLIVKSIPMYMDFEIDNTELTLVNFRDTLTATVKNSNENDSEKYNSVDMKYRFVDDSSTLNVKVAGDGVQEDNESIVINGGSKTSNSNTITVYVSNSYELPTVQECNITIETISPYVTTKSLTISVTDSGIFRPSEDSADLGVEFSSEFGTIEVIWLEERTNVPTLEPNSPDLYTYLAEEEQLTPVTWTYNEEGVTVAEQTVNWVEDESPRLDDWYNYTTSTGTTQRIDNTIIRWANAKNKDGSYFVWIPRYAYRIIYYSNEEKTEVEGFYDGYGKWRISDGKKQIELDPGIESVEINGKSYIVHPAFMKDTEKVDANGNALEDYARGGWDDNLRGFWVAKYEISRTDATAADQGSTSNNNFRIVPGVTSAGTVKSGKYLQYALTYDANKESHMIKMSEWGAVAYLTESQYGRNAYEISTNNTNITGNGSNSTTDDTGESYAYNTIFGAKSSSTGNVYGVYDMSGGKWEYVAGYNRLAEPARLSNSTYYAGEFTKLTKDANGNYISTKYATAYENAEKENRLPSKIYDIGKIGDATKEVMTANYSAESGAFWNNDNSTYCAYTVPIWGRGGGADESPYSGIFYSDSTNGSGFAGCSTRYILAD